MTSLNTAPVGEPLEIKWITGSRDLLKRIQELGVREGERITVLSACFDGIMQCGAQCLVLMRIGSAVIQLCFGAGYVGFHLLDVFVRNLGTCNEGGNFFFFGTLPADE